MNSTDECIKHREIPFFPIHEDRHQAQSAVLLLNDIEGITHVAAPSDTVLQVSYDLRLITYQIIEQVLAEVGFHLDNSLLMKLKRSLISYMEETQLANLGIEHDLAHLTQDVFIKHYRHLRPDTLDARQQRRREHS